MSLLDLFEKSVKPILTRYYILRSKWLGIKLHHIKESDPEFHTHPWWGISFHLRPYAEERRYYTFRKPWQLEPDVHTTMRRKWFVNIVSPWTPHRVMVCRPTWTLFIHGPRVNENWQYGEVKAPWRGPDAA